MRLYTATLVAVLASAACAYHSPDAPSAPPPASTSAPAYLTLGSTAGSGPQAGQSTVTAKVQNINGAPLAAVAVSFKTDVGTVSPTSATTNDNGIATTTVAAPESARVTATVGSLTTVLLVATPAPSVTPSPSPTPQPQPQPPPSPLGPVSMSITTAAVTVGQSTIFTANIQNASGTFNMTWDYGDGSTGSGTSSTTAHTYAAAGTYHATAILRDDSGRSASASTDAVVNPAPVVAPPNTRPPAISATLACTGTTHGSATFCNVTVLDQDGNVVTGKVPSNGVDWDWGDGTSGSVGVTSNHTYQQAGTFTVQSVVSLNGLRTNASKVLTIQ